MNKEIRINLGVNLAKIKFYGKGLLVLGAIGGIVWLVGSLYDLKQRREVTDDLAKGFPALASRVVIEHPKSFSSTPEGCGAGVEALVRSGEPRQLQYLVESCANSGVDTPDLAFAEAKLADMDGNHKAALANLERGIKRFPDSRRLRRTEVDLLLELNRPRDALKVAEEALQRGINDPRIEAAALSLYVKYSMASEAKALAQTIKRGRGDDLPPELKELIDSAFALPDTASPALQDSAAQAQPASGANIQTRAGSSRPLLSSGLPSPPPGGAITTLSPEEEKRIYPNGLPLPHGIGVPAEKKYPQFSTAHSHE